MSLRFRYSPMHALFLAVTPWALASFGSAQGLQDLYFSATESGQGVIHRASDLNQDGDYEDPNELWPFYRYQSTSTQYDLIFVRRDGSVMIASNAIGFVGDIVHLRDIDGDGTAEGPGESTLWLRGQGLNGSALNTGSINGLWEDADQVLWAAVDLFLSGGFDGVARFEDADFSGDVNGPGEATIYHDALPFGPDGSFHFPQDLVHRGGGVVDYLENGNLSNNNSTRPAGLYRLTDLDGSGSIDQATERALFFRIPPSMSGVTPGAISIHMASPGSGGLGAPLYLDDRLQKRIWRIQDLDLDGAIAGPNEARVIDLIGAGVDPHLFDVQEGEALIVAQPGPAGEFVRVTELPGGLQVDTVLSQATLANFGTVRAMALAPERAVLGARGCDPAVPNSTGKPASLTITGEPRAFTGSLDLRVECAPQGAFGLFLAGPSISAPTTPMGLVGNLCLDGGIGRYDAPGEIFQAGNDGAATLTISPNATPTPSGRVPVLGGQTWFFQAWYRDGGASNLSNSVGVRFDS